jgi:predicted adenylyl cyclase CyaB
MPPARNIELKARLNDLSAARETAKGLATARLGEEIQRDTYFRCARGRLKLREIEGGAGQLIAYQRPDAPDAKASDYRLLSLPDSPSSQALRELLATALGILVVVSKKREIFLYHNVRIHLDEVADLGSFLEFEAVVGGEINDARAREQVEWLHRQFPIAEGGLLSHSYSDMLLEVANRA